LEAEEAKGAADESLGMVAIGGVENELAVFADADCFTVALHGWGPHSDPRMAMFVVVPGEKRLAEGSAVLT
jgi:hypothetical protein